LTHDRCETEFDTETSRLAVAVGGLAPTTSVPTCPEWTVRDLVTHVGTGHRWAAEVVEGRMQTPPPYAVVDAPQDRGAWSDWLTAGAARLTRAVRDCGADAPVWTWRAEGTAGFWLRKMLHDELVHRFDIELACGGPGEVAPDVAADGVQDLLAGQRSGPYRRRVAGGTHADRSAVATWTGTGVRDSPRAGTGVAARG